MTELKNKDELIEFVKLYNTGKIKKFSLECFLTNACKKANVLNDVDVVISENKNGLPSKTYGACVLPVSGGYGMPTVSIIVDSRLFGIAEPEQVVEVIEAMLPVIPAAIKKLADFGVSNIGSKPYFSDTLLSYIKIFELSIDALRRDPVSEKILDNLPCVIEIEKFADRINDGERASDVLEDIVISGAIPYEYIEESRKIAGYVFGASYDGDPDTPDQNVFFSQYVNLSKQLSGKDIDLGAELAELQDKIIDFDFSHYSKTVEVPDRQY